MRHLIAVTVILLLLGAAPAPAQPPHVIATPDTLKWVEPPTFPGARLAIVHGDPSKDGLFVYRVKMPANDKIAPHFHKASENVTVLSGTFHIGLGTKLDQGSGTALPVGGFIAITSHASALRVGRRRGDPHSGSRRRPDGHHVRESRRRSAKEVR